MNPRQVSVQDEVGGPRPPRRPRATGSSARASSRSRGSRSGAQRATQRATVADPRRHGGPVALDLHAPAATVAELAASEVAVHVLGHELEPRRQALDHGRPGPCDSPAVVKRRAMRPVTPTRGRPPRHFRGAAPAQRARFSAARRPPRRSLPAQGLLRARARLAGSSSGLLERHPLQGVEPRATRALASLRKALVVAAVPGRSVRKVHSARLGRQAPSPPTSSPACRRKTALRPGGRPEEVATGSPEVGEARARHPAPGARCRGRRTSRRRRR